MVNNAQASKSGKMLVDHTKEDFDLAIYSGLYATFFYMREAFPYLKETKGCVINFASGAGACGAESPNLLCGGKGRHPRSFEGCGHRVGALRRESKRHLPACDDGRASEV